MLETVFRQVAGPLAVAETPGAWWRGLRLLALDGTQFDVPDSVSTDSWTKKHTVDAKASC